VDATGPGYSMMACEVDGRVYSGARGNAGGPEWAAMLCCAVSVHSMKLVKRRREDKRIASRDGERAWMKPAIIDEEQQHAIQRV
jgi:hypothetical protein